MNYQETLNYLFSQLPMFQRIGKAAYKADLGNTLQLDEYFNHPHKNFKSIHIAGTNGKGSTSHMLASILQSAGYKVGLYTSPHLKDFRERIRINGEMIPEIEVIDFVAKHKSLFEQVKPSFFEMTVALAFDYFSREKVDIAVVEVGLGGRLDSTNIITPLLSVITNIGLDHTDLLGDTLPKIATEKAGIIKKGVPVVISQFQPEVSQVFTDKAQETKSELIFAEQQYKVEKIDYSDTFQSIAINHQGVVTSWDLDLMGSYQKFNLAGVLASIDILNKIGLSISRDSVVAGLKSVQKSTGLMGRWQKLQDSPKVFCDTGHNVDGITQVLEQINRIPHKQLHMVIGMVGDKNIVGMLALLPKDATYYFTKASIPRALDQNELQQRASNFGLKGNTYLTINEALVSAKNNAEIDDLIFVGGSTFVVAEVV
ncbi:MAG TPA: folylpolyglutamate synthase/dihydrofolate synthase family protein [Tenuifilaceae bacterium]|nr:folylpolyglutamate synthase/dihydrofolate synthase family protein [Tenuifilaceae bacterium]HPI46063.1 folylpolyglutamate synthase/dihydrofolate synthase family protein [Tenuifilaceae bacterium]HPN22564.1 folylpolyglutamate synthase/dihydrofolate synthase family protein [Tenuifilaceae bacterium]